MKNSTENLEQSLMPDQKQKTQKVVVLRWGHRPQRDVRMTSHVALTARALGASGFLLSDTVDRNLEKTIKKVVENWGGTFFFEMGKKWKSSVRKWKSKGGIVVHLTVYGQNLQTSSVLDKIRETGKDILVMVGSQKVPGEFFSDNISDFNVAVGNQPHSECAALAVFLDRFFEGREMADDFKQAKIRVVPQRRGKKTIVNI